MTDRMMTLHPDGKQGVNIEALKYEEIKQAILASLSEREVLFRDLPASVSTHLTVPFDGSIGWYTTTVKLDLEARGIIERIPGHSPQKLRLAR